MLALAVAAVQRGWGGGRAEKRWAESGTLTHFVSCFCALFVYVSLSIYLSLSFLPIVCWVSRLSFYLSALPSSSKPAAVLRQALEATKAPNASASQAGVPRSADGTVLVTQKLRPPRLPGYTGGVGSTPAAERSASAAANGMKAPAVVTAMPPVAEAQPKSATDSSAAAAEENQPGDGARDLFGFGDGDEVIMAPALGAVGQGTRFLRPDSGHSAEWHRRHGNAALAAGDWAEAAAEYSAAISIEPHRALFYTNRAAAWLRGGQWLDAVADACAALDADESFVRAIIYRANAYLALEEFEAASHDFAAALHAPLMPEASRTHCLLRLGLCLWRSEARCVARIEALSKQSGADLSEGGNFARVQMALLRRAIDVHVAIAQAGAVDSDESVFTPPSRETRQKPSLLPDMDPNSAMSRLHLARRIGIDLHNILAEIALYEQLFLGDGDTSRLDLSVRVGIMAAAEKSLSERLF